MITLLEYAIGHGFWHWAAVMGTLLCTAVSVALPLSVLGPFVVHRGVEVDVDLGAVRKEGPP